MTSHEGPGRTTYCVNVDVRVTTMETNARKEEEGQLPEDPRKSGGSKDAKVGDRREQADPGAQESVRSGGLRDEGRQPWKNPKYGLPPNRASDAWDLSYWDEGWLVREHGKWRKRRFHPVHGSTPATPTELEESRYTIRFREGGGRDEHMDDWRGAAKTEDNEKWRGYTFVKVKPRHRWFERTGPVPSRMADDNVSNGSYEMISE